MRKLFAVLFIVLGAAVVYSADQTIQYNEQMVGAGHPTLADTLNRALLVDHETDGTHSASTIGSSQITDNSIVNADVNSAAAIDATKIGGGLVTNTELSYLDNVTSAIQTQFGLKAPLASPTFTGTVVIPTPFTVGAVSVTATGTELNYLVGVTSAIQTQLGLKAPLASPTFTGTVTAPVTVISGAGGGGSIDNTPIGASTPSTGAFSSLDVAQGDSGFIQYMKEAYANGTEYRAWKIPDSLLDNGAFLLPTAAPTEGQVWVFGAPSSTISTITYRTLGSKTILDNVSAPTAEQMYDSINVVNEAITVLLPTAVAGMNGCVQDTGAAHDIIVDVQATDNVILVGVEGAGGVGIKNTDGSSTGDYVCLVALENNKWTAMMSRGTWAAQ